MKATVFYSHSSYGETLRNFPLQILGFIHSLNTHIQVIQAILAHMNLEGNLVQSKQNQTSATLYAQEMGLMGIYLIWEAGDGQLIPFAMLGKDPELNRLFQEQHHALLDARTPSDRCRLNTPPSSGGGRLLNT